MTLRISSVLCVGMVVGAAGCRPKHPSTGHPADTIVATDTTRPVMPTTTAWPTTNPLLVTVPGNASYRNFRDVFAVQFEDSMSGITIRSFLARFNAVIIGGFGHGTSAAFYVVQVPDPGTTVEAVDSLEGAMGAHTGVKRAIVMNYEGSLRLKRPD